MILKVFGAAFSRKTPAFVIITWIGRLIEEQMRKGYRYITVRKDEKFSNSIDSCIDDFSEGMGYQRLVDKFVDREDFISGFFSYRPNREFNAALRQLLSKDRAIFGVGSGFGEHEILFHLDGFRITASDIVEFPLKVTSGIFPDFKVRFFDIFGSSLPEACDDLLITGLDSYFDDTKVKQLFNNTVVILRKLAGQKQKRLIFVLRYQDNPFTWFIDRLLLPFEAALKNLCFKLIRANKICRKKHHGNRRSIREISFFAANSGYKLNRLMFAGFGAELHRSSMLNRFPLLQKIISFCDKFLKVFNSIIIFEFILPVED